MFKVQNEIIAGCAYFFVHGDKTRFEFTKFLFVFINRFVQPITTHFDKIICDISGREMLPRRARELLTNIILAIELN